MRSEFLAGLADLADRDPRVVLLTADLGFGSIEVFADRHPKRYLNIGVAEQAMIGLATGLAEGGFIPYCYSIASFSVARTFEFLRNGPIAHGLPVRLIGIGPGMDYSYDGLTHFALEDVGLLLNQPSTRIIAPRDAASSGALGAEGSDHPGLVYYRLARSGPPIDGQGQDQPFAADCMVLSLGDAAVTGSEIAARLSAATPAAVQHIAVECLDSAELSALAERISRSPAKVVVTAENHYSRGGFGSALTDSLHEARWQGSLVKWGITTPPTTSLGSLQYMINTFCPSLGDICSEALALLSASERQ